MASARLPDEELQFAALQTANWVTASYATCTFLISDLQSLILAYLDDEPKKHVPSLSPKKHSFFYHYVSQIQYRLEAAANDILSAGDVRKAIGLIRNHGKEVLTILTQGKDRFGSRIVGKTLLQIAGMAGDFHHREENVLKNDNSCGAVELLAYLGGLTQAELTSQLGPVLFSDQARKESKARVEHILNLLMEFVNSTSRDNIYLPAFELFRIELSKAVSNQTITTGYILDSQIFIRFNQWFKKQLKRFNPEIGNYLWMHCYGSLQCIAPPNDACKFMLGISVPADNRQVVGYYEQFTDEFILSSELGKARYYVFRGDPGLSINYAFAELDMDKSLMDVLAMKNKYIAKLVLQRQDHIPKHKNCLVM
jgi:hypothetical protein